MWSNFDAVQPSGSDRVKKELLLPLLFKEWFQSHTSAEDITRGSCNEVHILSTIWIQSWTEYVISWVLLLKYDVL